MNPHNSLYTRALTAVVLAIALLLTASAATSAGQTVGGQREAPVVTSSGVFKIPSVTVELTEIGSLPSAISVTVGAQVTWVNMTNQTIQLSDQPLAVGQVKTYLPFVTASGARQTTAAKQDQPGWMSETITSGGQYSRVFQQSGVFPYYASHHSGVVGTVTVLSATLVSTELIDAARGGTVTAGDSTLYVPPGALAHDTTITVGRPINGASLNNDGMTAISLEAQDLQLLAPLILTLRYNEPVAEFDESFIQEVAYDEQTNKWTLDRVVAFDPIANTISVAIEHFSWRWYYIDQPLYLVLDIPGKYLRPGDILVRMGRECDTKQGIWFPGHTGIYSDTVGTTTAAEVDERIIEANRIPERACLVVRRGFGRCTLIHIRSIC